MNQNTIITRLSNSCSGWYPKLQNKYNSHLKSIKILGNQFILKKGENGKGKRINKR